MPIILVPQADAYGKTEQFIMDNGGTVTLPNGDTLTFSDISVFKSPSYLNQFPNGQLPANTILPNGQTYKEVLDFYQANPNGTPTVSKPNLAPATNKGVETNAPAPAKQNDGQRVGAPTTPSLGIGGVVGMGNSVTLSGFNTYLVTFTNTAAGTGTGTANVAINYAFSYQSGAGVVSGGGIQIVGQLITTANTRGTYTYNTILVLASTGTANFIMTGYLGGSGCTLSVSSHQLSIVGIA
jgi:hypothetical protein